MSQEPNLPPEGLYRCRISDIELSPGGVLHTLIKCKDIVLGRCLILGVLGNNIQAWNYIAKHKPILTLRVKHRRIPPTATKPEHWVFGVTLRAIGPETAKPEQA